MKLRAFIESLNEFVADNPEALEFEAVYAKDSEGNGYSSVTYTPSLGKYKNREFEQEKTV